MLYTGNMTDYADLPRDKMKRLTIAFDVDGTLRCNCTDICEDQNEDIVSLFRIFRKMKNTELYVWSGGGAAYALRFARLYGLDVKDGNCLSKFSGFKPDIAIDDIQETALGAFNLIVREK